MERRRGRKADLLVAARQAIAEHGAAVQLNQIADKAGVTSGAVLYHYPHVPDLLIEANRAGMERFYNLRMTAIRGIADPAERLIVTIRSGVPRSSQDEDVRLLCALGGEAARNTVYAVLLTALYDRQVGMYQGILEAGAAQGVFALRQDSMVTARTLVALEDAYGYRIVAQHPTLDYETAVHLILEFARLATDHRLVDHRSLDPYGGRSEHRPASNAQDDRNEE